MDATVYLISSPLVNTESPHLFPLSTAVHILMFSVGSVDCGVRQIRLGYRISTYSLCGLRQFT